MIIYSRYLRYLTHCNYLLCEAFLKALFSYLGIGAKQEQDADAFWDATESVANDTQEGGNA
jgi:hypothetical protein